MSRSAALHRVPLALGNDADEALIADDPDAGNVMHRALIKGERHRTRDRRANHSAMQHPRHLHVGDVVERAEDLGRDVEARRRLADNLVGVGRLRLCLSVGDEIVARSCRSSSSAGGNSQRQLVALASDEVDSQIGPYPDPPTRGTAWRAARWCRGPSGPRSRRRACRPHKP
jgi:hypothetical protein